MKSQADNRSKPGIVAASLLLAAGTAGAADAVKLKVADSFPQGHYIQKSLTQPFMDEVRRLTSNAVDFEYYPGEQLGKAKDMLSLTQAGVADIAYVAPSFVSDKIPLAEVGELPGLFKTSCEGTRAYWQLAKAGGILDQKEFKPQGVRVLFSLVLPPYQVFLGGNNKLENLTSLKGLKIRSSGLKDLVVRSFGATPVQMATPEVYESLSRGTIDGMLFPYSSIMSYDLQGLVKYSTVGENFGSFVVNYVMNLKKWNSLAPDIQKAIDQAGADITGKGCVISQEVDESDMKKIEAAGDKLVTLSAQDKKTLAAGLDTIAHEWAKRQDQRRKPGTEVLNAFQEALKK